jgi:calcineurin-like phosphoesterase family protein
MSKIFLTANTHFGRLKIVEKRGFSSVDEMNESIILSWNDVVKPNDIVYHLGYFAHDPITTTSVLEFLNGQIYFLNNNTDKTLPEVSHLFNNLTFIDAQIYEIPEKNVFLSYYPMEVWAGNNSYHFYGDNRIKTDLSLVSKRMSVSYDIWQKPILLDVLIEMIHEYEK